MKYNPSIGFATYEEIKKYVQKNNIKTLKQWYSIYKERKIPRKYPRSIMSIYKKNWEGSAVFFNTKNPSRKVLNYLNYKDLEKIILKKNFNNAYEYKKFVKKNNKEFEYPLGPDRIYVDKGWKDWGTFLGKPPRYRDYVSFNEAKKYFKRNRILSSSSWAEFKKRNKIPDNIPKKPSFTYEGKGWKGWSNFLGKKK